MCKVSKLIRNGLAIAAGITAYQAAQKTRLETGSFYGDTFGRNFKDQLMANAKLVADIVRTKLGQQSAGAVCEVSRNVDDRADAEPAVNKAKAQESAESVKKLGKKLGKKPGKKSGKKSKEKTEKTAKEKTEKEPEKEPEKAPEKETPDREDKGQAQP